MTLNNKWLQAAHLAATISDACIVHEGAVFNEERHISVDKLEKIGTILAKMLHELNVDEKSVTG